MRIDKYLKVTRLIKRRTIAKEILEDEVIRVNNKIAKPAHQLKLGDVIDLSLGKHHLVVKVKIIKEAPKREEIEEMYEIILDEVINRAPTT